MYNREQWKKDNPRLYECVWKSFREAIAWINEDKKRGAELFHRFTKSKMELEEVIEMTTTPGEVDYLLEPERTMQLAEFLHGAWEPSSSCPRAGRTTTGRTTTTSTVADSLPSGGAAAGPARLAPRRRSRPVPGRRTGDRAREVHR